jgi:hypothetical protein
MKAWISWFACSLMTCFMAACGVSARRSGQDPAIFVIIGGMFFIGWVRVSITMFRSSRPGGVRVTLTPSAPARRSARLKPRQGGDLIERLCRETGWGLIGEESGRYQVRSRGTRSPVAIEVCYGERQVNVLFQSWLPIRFSLEKPPAGLCARVLLRNHPLNWGAWQLSIGGSCEACLCVVASVPRTALDAWLFHEVCTEIADELRGFHQELHDRFLYDLGGVVQEPTPAAVPWEVHGSYSDPPVPPAGTSLLKRRSS